MTDSTTAPAPSFTTPSGLVVDSDTYIFVYVCYASQKLNDLGLLKGGPVVDMGKADQVIRQADSLGWEPPTSAEIAAVVEYVQSGRADRDLRDDETEFEKWATTTHRRIEKSAGEPGILDCLSDSGYWRVMCHAAWAEKAHPNHSVELELADLRDCLAKEDEEEGNCTTCHGTGDGTIGALCDTCNGTGDFQHPAEVSSR